MNLFKKSFASIYVLFLLFIVLGFFTPFNKAKANVEYVNSHFPNCSGWQFDYSVDKSNYSANEPLKIHASVHTGSGDNCYADNIRVAAYNGLLPNPGWGFMLGYSIGAVSGGETIGLPATEINGVWASLGQTPVTPTSNNCTIHNAGTTDEWKDCYIRFVFGFNERCTANCGAGNNYYDSTFVKDFNYIYGANSPTLEISADSTSLAQGGSTAVHWLSSGTSSCVVKKYPVNNPSNLTTLSNTATFGDIDTGALNTSTTYYAVCDVLSSLVFNDSDQWSLKNIFKKIFSPLKVLAQSVPGGGSTITSFVTINVTTLPVTTANLNLKTDNYKNLVDANNSTNILGTSHLTINISNLPNGKVCNLYKNTTITDVYDNTLSYPIIKDVNNIGIEDPFQLKCTDPTSAVSQTVSVKGQSGTLAFANNNNTTCIIPSGQSSCTIPLTWATTNPHSNASSYYGQIKEGGDILATTSNGTNQNIALYGTNMTNGATSIVKTLKSYNHVDGENGTSSSPAYAPENELATLNVTVMCTTGTSWFNGICKPTATPNLTAANITFSPSTGITTSTNVTFSSIITNNGTTSTGGSFNNFFQVSSEDPNGIIMSRTSKPSFFSWLINKVSAAGDPITDLTPKNMSTLASGATSTTTQTYKFPNNGMYWVRACADKSNRNTIAPGDILELNENDNCSPSWISINVGNTAANGVCGATHYLCTIGSSINQNHNTTNNSYTWQCQGLNGGTTASCSELKPDLTADTPLKVNNYNNPGFLKFSSEVRNIGANTTGATFHNVFRVATLPNGGGVVNKFEADSIMRILTSGDHDTAYFTYNLSGVSVGSYYLSTCADKNVSMVGTITESEEGNNCSGDLLFNVTEGVGLSGTINATNCSIAIGGDTCESTITWSTLNPVSGKTSEVWTPKPKNDPTGVPTNNTTNDVKIFTGNSNVGINNNTYPIYHGSRNFSLYHNNVGLGYATGIAECVSGSVWDGKVTNKCISNLLSDLTASSPTPTTVLIDSPIIFKSQIINNGASSTGASFVNLFQTSTSSDGSKNLTDYPTVSMAALGINSSNTASSTKIIFSDKGPYWIRACADKNSSGDVDGVINESNETNNCSAWMSLEILTDIAPDLMSSVPVSQIGQIKKKSVLMAGALGSTLGEGGQTKTFSFEVTNTGTGPTDIPFQNLFQVSENADGSGFIDYPVKKLIPILSPGESAVSVSDPIPFSQDLQFYVRSCADKSNADDAIGKVKELNEENNCSAWGAANLDPKLQTDGYWTWGPWSDCSAPCGPGTETRTGICTPPVNGGYDPCSSENPQTQACDLGSCTLSCANGAIDYPACKECSDGSSPESNPGGICPANTTVILKAKPATIFKGRFSTLTWTSSPGTISCTSSDFATGGLTNNSTGVKVFPSITKTYSISCKNGSSTGIGQAVVKVINPVIIEN